jgi:hypothetical protein
VLPGTVAMEANGCHSAVSLVAPSAADITKVPSAGAPRSIYRCLAWITRRACRAHVAPGATGSWLLEQAGRPIQNWDLSSSISADFARSWA